MLMRARLAAAAAAVAVAIWLVPASVHIVDWTASGPVRVALVAPVTRLWFGAGASAVAFAAIAFLWTRSGRALAELARVVSPLALLFLLLIPYLPWVADRAPLLLVLAGPVRWGVVALALGAATMRVMPPIAVRVPRAAVFVASFSVYCFFGLTFASEVGYGGDEPHYLVIAHSLMADRDLDIANNHAQRDYRAFFGGDLRPDFLRRGRHEEIYSIHAPGLAVALLPAYAIGGAAAAVVMIALLAALTALAIFDAALLLTSPATATLVWATLCLTVPFVPHAWLIYPELPAALIVAWSVVWWLQPESSTARLVLQGVAVGCLPWLHTKFVVLVPLLAGAYALRLWPRVRAIAAFALPIVALGAAWLTSFYVMYGVFDPQVPYGTSTRLIVLFSNIPRGVLG